MPKKTNWKVYIAGDYLDVSSEDNVTSINLADPAQAELVARALGSYAKSWAKRNNHGENWTAYFDPFCHQRRRTTHPHKTSWAQQALNTAVTQLLGDGHVEQAQALLANAELYPNWPDAKPKGRGWADDLAAQLIDWIMRQSS